MLSGGCWQSQTTSQCEPIWHKLLQSGQAMKSVENIELAWTALASNRQQKGMRYSIVPLRHCEPM